MRHQWSRGSALKLVDERRRVQSLVALVDLAVHSFPCFLRNSRKYGLGTLSKTPHGGHSTHKSRSPMIQSTLKPTTNQATKQSKKFVKIS